MRAESKNQRETRVKARAETLLARLFRGKDQPSRVYRWPGTQQLFVFAALTSTDAQECKAEARARLLEMGIQLDAFSADDFDDECWAQLLTKTCRMAPEGLAEGQPVGEETDARKLPPLAVDADDLRDNTYPDDRATVSVWYKDFERTVDPRPNELAPEALSAISELVKKKDRTTLLNSYASPELVTYLLSMGDPPSSSPDGK